MRCDERYRSRASQQVSSEPDPELYRAELTRVSPCQSRPGFRELHFDVEGTPWSWCFPPRDSSDDSCAVPTVSRLVLRPGPHGLRAQGVTDVAGAALDVAEIDLVTAAGLALSAAPVYVHRFLIGRIGPEPGDPRRRQASRGDVSPAGRSR
ncbi:MAG TPA: hypothetical protein VEH05_00585 [Streptosporangiaceae bacterium]|nr:hypothetical protein [Streptosporangiaceae bacterium]